jgi:hypothetical protein
MTLDVKTLTKKNSLQPTRTIKVSCSASAKATAGAVVTPASIKGRNR